MGDHEAQGMWIGADGSAKHVRVSRNGRIKSGPLFEAFHGIGDGDRRNGRDLSGSAADLARAYSSEVWAYRCIKQRSDALAGVPLILVDRDGKRITEHPILDLLRDVNPHTMNLGDLLRATESAYNIWGAAYWLKVTAAPNGAANGRVKWLVWLNPQTIEVIKDGQRGIVGYKQRIGSETRVFAPEEIIAFRNFDPMDDLGGLSSLGVALNQINAELNAARYVAAFFANDARPAGLLTTDQPMMDAEVERTRTWWQKLFQGVGNKWNTGIVGGGLKWQTISFPPDDLALAELRAEDRRAICAVFGVPAGVAGAWETMNYASAREQKASFYEDTMIPQMQYVAEVLNWSLLRPHYPDLAAMDARLVFDFDSITALRESATAKAAMLTNLYQTGVMTRDEVRAELGLPVDAPPEPVSPVDSGSGEGEPRERDGEDGDARSVGARHALPLQNGANGNGNGHSKKALQAELDRWERFVLKRMKAKRPFRSYKSAAIPPDLWWRIASGLARVKNVDEVRRVFEQVMSSEQQATSEVQSAAGAD